MADQRDRIDQLTQKLNLLENKQDSFAQEIQALYREIQQLKQSAVESSSVIKEAPVQQQIISGSAVEKEVQVPLEKGQSPVIEPTKVAPKVQKPKRKSNLEKFIGENLINKIGIAILVIGVGIGAKYSIENNLISPLTRIILGYLAGLGLLAFGIKLKAKYENYSAVLVSGALAILYFITFAAYDFYDLFPQLMAFGLMLVFTVFGVVSALNYNKQIIAHIGLVGAYAVPFLLSDGSGDAMVFFSYVAMINLGILIIAFKKYWKPLYYSAFIFTWLIYGTFAIFTYEPEKHFQISLTFISIFFALFYAIFLAYKLKANEKFKKSDVVLLLLNSFIFYGLGYGLLSQHEIGKQLLGVFTLGNAVVHFLVSTVIYKKKLADRNLFYLVSGLVLVFITIAVPVQLDGNWVTLLWVLEAALLFWIGRTKNVPVYEYLSYPLMILAFFSLLEDWENAYNAFYLEQHFTSIANINLLSSLIFVAAFGFMNWINGKPNNTSKEQKGNWMASVMSFGIPILFLVSLYGAFYLEIGYYFDKLFQLSEIPTTDYGGGTNNYELKDFGTIWQLNFTLLFIAAIMFVNIIKLKKRVLGIIALTIGLMATLLFLTAGLYTLSELRQSFLHEDLSSYATSNFNIGIRYVAIGFFALLIFALYKLSKASFMRINFKLPFEFLLHTSVLWILSSELLNWMDIFGSDQTYKLGLSILWGLYSLFLIALGIYKNKKYLRIGAITLFAVTLAKLFFYDIASMNTITKTIVFVSLGILLLIISFLYNKYKHKIANEDEK